MEQAKYITTLRSGKIIDKTILARAEKPKDPQGTKNDGPNNGPHEEEPKKDCPCPSHERTPKIGRALKNTAAPNSLSLRSLLLYPSVPLSLWIFAPSSHSPPSLSNAYPPSLTLSIAAVVKLLPEEIHVIQNPSHIFEAENTFGDISGKVVADFGCGCGTLGIAGALLGAEHVVGIDIDSQSLEIASLNAADLELDINLIWCDIKNLQWRGKIVDTVVMNPPFGTRKKGSNMDFLFTTLKVASHAVYSLHKTTARDHVRRAALRDFNAKSAEVLCEGPYYCGAGVDKALGRSYIWTISARIILTTGDQLYFEICLFRNVNAGCIA
ncbi:uncharacterized protein LOC131224292 [Magnolia sinica]|uniref:uncharacterized protein LOC131224292 n=1 Tax=Magnolia sinica TaxID=86752 RepID=UPI002657DB89|nr:uncharacterized protein LOC131224292 [Magnolia sinica]